MTGVIENYGRKNFGWILADQTGARIWFHNSDAEEREKLRPGLRVQFVLETYTKKQQSRTRAACIKILPDAPVQSRPTAVISAVRAVPVATISVANVVGNPPTDQK